MDEGDDTPIERVMGGFPSDAIEGLQLHEVPSPQAYADVVATATDRISAGALRKVVLARTIEVEAGRVLDPRRLAQRLRAVNPDAYTFAAPAADGVLVGASPELLVARHGREVTANPLAGSARRAGDPDEDRANAEALRASAKDLEEHAIVVEALAGTLGPFCEALRWDPEPVLLETPKVWHLSTRFRGVLREPAPSSVDLVEELETNPVPPSHALQVDRRQMSDRRPDFGGLRALDEPNRLNRRDRQRRERLYQRTIRGQIADAQGFQRLDRPPQFSQDFVASGHSAIG